MEIKVHLAVIQENITLDGEEHQATRLFNPRRTEFVWNGDFTAFRPVPLRWWDDASYLRYQAGDTMDDCAHDDTLVNVCNTLGHLTRCETWTSSDVPF